MFASFSVKVTRMVTLRAPGTAWSKAADSELMVTVSPEATLCLSRSLDFSGVPVFLPVESVV